MKCAEVFERMDEKFEEFGISDVYGVFQFNVKGREGGQWFAVCEGDSCVVREGEYDRPDVTLFSKDEVVVKLAQGRLNPALAFLTRKVKVKGNLTLLTKVQGLLKGLAY